MSEPETQVGFGLEFENFLQGQARTAERVAADHTANVARMRLRDAQGNLTAASAVLLAITLDSSTTSEPVCLTPYGARTLGDMTSESGHQRTLPDSLSRRWKIISQMPRPFWPCATSIEAAATFDTEYLAHVRDAAMAADRRRQDGSLLYIGGQIVPGNLLPAPVLLAQCGGTLANFYFRSLTSAHTANTPTTDVITLEALDNLPPDYKAPVYKHLAELASKKDVGSPTILVFEGSLPDPFRNGNSHISEIGDQTSVFQTTGKSESPNGWVRFEEAEYLPPGASSSLVKMAKQVVGACLSPKQSRDFLHAQLETL